jgi:hypothetical protein
MKDFKERGLIGNIKKGRGLTFRQSSFALSL